MVIRAEDEHVRAFVNAVMTSAERTDVVNLNVVATGSRLNLKAANLATVVVTTFEAACCVRIPNDTADCGHDALW